MKRNWTHQLCLALAILGMSAFTLNCAKKKDRGGGDGESTEGENDPDIGEEAPPITPDKGPVVLETNENGAIRLLTVEATESKEVGRYRSEYLLVVRALADSCIRLKVRPTEGGVTDEVADTNLEDDGGTAACAEGKANLTGSTALTQPKPEPKRVKRHVEPTKHLDFRSPTKRALRNREFGLVEDTLCATRLFRMPVLDGEGSVDKVRNKTGRLAYKTAVDVGGQTRMVYVWLDEEVSRITCDANGMEDNSKIAFSPLWKFGRYRGFFDQLTFAHVEAIGKNAAQTFKSLSESLGALSDVDENNGIDVFISPDTNRLRFRNLLTNTINQFRANLDLRSNDLANYDGIKNPAGNEGEIIYLWAPDPYARFKQGTYPSSGSLTSNYARGYMGTQVMNMILTKKRLLDNNWPQEETWIREGLGLLASAYVGGNDYSFYSLANYLSSRPQHISLTEKVSADRFTAEGFNWARDEQLGLRAMFAWYLHSLKCGTSREPCGEVSKLFDTETTGVATIEAFSGKSFAKTLEHFGLSVGIELLDKPSDARSFWDNLTAEELEQLPERFIDLPELRRITNGDETQFINTTFDASTHDLQEMPRFGGPFVSYDMELFQPIFPDNDLDISLAKNSVTYIYLSGLLERKTDITAALGSFLNVVIIPAGERKSDDALEDGRKRTRFFHSEKVSENAHIDVAPTNLTSTVASRTANTSIADADLQNEFQYPSATNYRPMEYPSLADSKATAVTVGKELWIVGNTENFTIQQGGGDTQVGDTDAYNIEINPCQGLTGDALTNCQDPCQNLTGDAETACRRINRGHQVIFQLHARDFPSEVNPMFLVTDTDPELFRGAQVLGTTTDWVPELDAFVQDEAENGVGILCDAPENHAGLTDGACATNGVQKPGDTHKIFYDHQDYLAESKFAFNGDSYLYLGPLTYPFSNAWNMWQEPGDGDRATRFDFLSEERSRMFYDFNYKKDNDPFRFFVYETHYDDTLGAHRSEASQGSNIPYGDVDLNVPISEEVVQDYDEVKTFLDGCCATLSEESLDSTLETFDALGVNPEEVRAIAAPYIAAPAEISQGDLDDIEDLVLDTLYDAADRRKYYACIKGTGCATDMNGINSVGTGGAVVTSAWNIPWIGTNLLTVYRSFYSPLHSKESPFEGKAGCNAQAVADPVELQNTIGFCDVSESNGATMPTGDIRHQFNVAASDFKVGCRVYEPQSEDRCFFTNHKVSGDSISYSRVNFGQPGVSFYNELKIPIEGELTINPIPADSTDTSAPTPQHSMYHLSIAAGELVAKERRFHSQAITIPYGTTSLNTQVITGGRALSQGKYLLRVRIKNMGQPVPESEMNFGRY